MCPRGWKRDKEATDDMPRWIHELTGAGQWDFPNLMKFEINIMSGQPLESSTMNDWSTKATIKLGANQLQYGNSSPHSAPIPSLRQPVGVSE